MKTIFKFGMVAALMLASAKAHASHTYRSTFINESGLAYNNTYTLDTTNLQLDSISMQCVYSSASFSPATFTDGSASTGTITVTSYTGIHGVQGTDTLTVVAGKNSALAAAYATDTLTVSSNSTTALNGSSFTLNGKKFSFNKDYFIGTSTQATAASMATAISGNTNFGASASGGVVTIACAMTGIACNSYTLVSSTPAAVSVGSAKFTGGQDPVYFNLNGSKLLNGIDWSTGQSSTNTAASIVTAVSGVNGFTATASSNVVTISCASSGTFCNSYTLTSSSPAALLAGGGTFSGGINPGRLAINGTVLVEGVDFTAATSSATTANHIAVAINANSILNTLITSTAPLACGLSNACGVVVLAGSSVGLPTNYALWSSNYAALTPFAPAMRGATNSAIRTDANAITLKAHGFTTALPVLYTKTAGTSPGKLSAGTTYFVIPVDANTIKLASSSGNAVSGTSVGISTQTTTGGGSFALSPLTYAGTASWDWEASNDNSNWNPVALSSVTYSSPSYVPTATAWDFGSFDLRYLRLNVTGPTAGGLSLVCKASGKQNNPYRP